MSKGAPEAIFPRCKAFELDGVLSPMDDARIDELRQEYEHLSRDGFRVLAIASKDVEPSGEPPSYGRDDEKDLILNGYLAFLDPPKDTAATAIRALEQHGVSVKIVTGDNDLVARKVTQRWANVLLWLGSGSPVRVFSTHDTLKVIERDGIDN